MGTNHLRRAFQRALIVAQIMADEKALGPIVRSNWTGIAQTKTLCIACGDDLDVGQRYEKAHYTARPRWDRFVHELCPTPQEMIDILRKGQHEDLVMHSFAGQGGGTCERCSRRFDKYQTIYEVRPFGDLPTTGKIYQRCCKECVSVFS